MQKTILVLIGFTFTCFATTGYHEIKYKEAKRIFSAGSGLFIDARDLKFYKKGTILGALNMPIDRFNRLKRFLPLKKGSKLVVFCNGLKCEKSVKLAEKIVSLGYTKVMVFREGYPKWYEMRQDIMLSEKYCRLSDKPRKETSVNGVTVYLGRDEGMIDPTWFIKQYQRGALPKTIALVDVRNKKAFAEGHLPDAINIPWNSDKGTIDSNRFPRDRLILLYCNSGLLSSDAYDSLGAETAKRVLFLNATVKCKEGKCELRSLSR